MNTSDGSAMTPEENTVQAGVLGVKVASPYQTFYEGPAVSVSATNKTGPFDILAEHSNFFTLLDPGMVVIDTGFDKLNIEIENGLMKVANNKVAVFVNV